MRIEVMKTLLNMKKINMKIGVSGASGHLGRATVAELVQRPGGHEVVAISRTPETITALSGGRSLILQTVRERGPSSVRKDSRTR